MSNLPSQPPSRSGQGEQEPSSLSPLPGREAGGEGRLVLITGAAHRLGRAIALAFAERGYAVALHYHASHLVERATTDLLAAGASAVYPLPADLRDPAQVDVLFEAVAGLPHPLGVLVNSAAVMQRGSLRDMAVEDWDSTLDLNLRAPWLCARAAARLMETGGGAIINLTDSGAHKTWSAYPAYLISKAGLEALTRLLARTLAPAVRVNAVAPGLILPAPDLPPETWQRLVERLPLQAAGAPEDVARAVLFLVDNPYITGQTLVVDGGYQLI